MAMTMVRSGHTVLAESLLDEDFFMAWGDLGTNYADPWRLDEVPPPSASEIRTRTITKGALNTSDLINDVSVVKVVSLKGPNNAVYTVGTDFYLDENKINWSVGANEPAPGVVYTLVYRVLTDEITNLIHEIGRRRASEKSFVIEDTLNGDIIANGRRWLRVNYPTPNVFIAFRFESNEAVDTSIYQLAIYINTTVNTSLPIGQMYYLPNQITGNGSAFMIENVEPFPRNAGKREVFEFVIML